MPNALPWERKSEGATNRVIIGMYIKSTTLVKLQINLSSLPHRQLGIKKLKKRINILQIPIVKSSIEL